MKVIYYSRPCFLDHVLPQVKALSQLVEIHLLLELSPESWNSSLFDVAPRELPSGIVPADPLLRNCFPPGIRDYWKDVASFNLIVHNCPRSIHPVTWWISHKSAQFIRSLKPDIVHLDDVSLRLAWSLSKLQKVPMVLSLHDPEHHSGEHNWRTDLARWLTFRRTRQFILHNKERREPFCKKYGVPGGRVKVIPLGVLDIFREWIGGPVQEDGQTVLFFGRLSQYKGIDTLYQVAPMVAEKVANVRFVIAGRPVRGYRLPPAPTLDNGGRFEIIIRYITNTELAQLFQKAKIVVCPYTDATQSGVVLTAYAFGKPVVATNVGGLPEYVSDNDTGILVPPNDPETLASALVRLLQDGKNRQRMKQQILERGRSDLGWDQIARRTIEVYESLFR